MPEAPSLPAQATMHVAFASGGTGGHLYPGLAVARELSKKQSMRCLFFASEKPIEKQILSNSEFPFVVLPSCPPSLKEHRLFLRNLREGYRKAMQTFAEFRPEALVALGGYASFAPALAARRMGIPVVVQEQNWVAGRANMALSLLAKAVFAPVSGMEDQFWFSRVIPTGNPVRSGAMATERAEARRALGLDETTFTVLVQGGSQGAEFLNTLIGKTLDRMRDLQEKIQWIHLTGKGDMHQVADGYASRGWKATAIPYCEDMGMCYGACDLVLSRSGASTVSEIVANGLSAVLIPYPHAVRNHQRKNAMALHERGAAMVLEQEDLTPGALATVLISLHKNPDRLRAMREAALSLCPGDAAGAVAEQLHALIARRRGNARRWHNPWTWQRRSA